MIPAANFVGQTAISSSAGLGMPHDLNVYPQCAGWQFTVRRHRKPQSFETTLNLAGSNSKNDPVN